MKQILPALILAGAALAALSGPAHAEGKCSRNADDLKGDMIAMMPDGSYCEMDDGAKAKEQAQIAAYNRTVAAEEEPAPVTAGGKAGTGTLSSGGLYRKAYASAMMVCRDAKKTEEFCAAHAAEVVDTAMKKYLDYCQSHGTGFAECSARMSVEIDQVIRRM